MLFPKLDAPFTALLRPLVIAVAALGAAAVAADDDYADVRAEFLRAYAPLESGLPSDAAADSAALRAYPLYPYLERARLIREIDRTRGALGSIDERAVAFLAAHDAEPVAVDLRRAWLQSLARRNQHRALVEHYRPVPGDQSLRCRYLAARIELGETAGLEAVVRELWLTPERLPPECETPFEWLRRHSAMDADLIEQRARLLLENEQTAFARTIARRLPEARATPLRRWADLLDRPAATLDAALAAPTIDVDHEALLAGWTKLARDEPLAALARYPRLEAALPPERASGFALALALGLAWDRHAEALAVFDAVRSADLDDYALAWRARAALWSKDWLRLEQSIAAMSDAQRREPRWQYWLARAAEARGDGAAARELYESVLPSDNWYAANAAARLAVRAAPHPEPLERDAAAVERLEARGGFIRARELLQCELRAAATAEWLGEYARLETPDRKQAVHLAAGWQWHDVAVATATRQEVFYDYELLYPQPYEAEVRAGARAGKLDAALLYGVIRQESLFRADAVSAVGALGLAQLRPETARYVARESNTAPPSATDLLDPAVNLRLGAAHLRSLLDRFDGQLPVALAAYNAGRLPAERWLPDRPLDADIWVENIPYNETRDYVQRVLWHSVVFGWLRSDRKPQSVDAWLLPIGARITAAL